MKSQSQLPELKVHKSLKDLFLKRKYAQKQQEKDEMPDPYSDKL